MRWEYAWCIGRGMVWIKRMENMEHSYDWRMVGLRMMVEIEVDEQEQWKWRVQNFHLLCAAHGLC